MRAIVFVVLLVCAIGLSARAADPLALGPEELVRTTNGLPIAVSGYSVPSLADWDSDGRLDLIVGEGSGSSPGKVRVYLNVGSVFLPRFTSYSYAQSNGFDLSVPGSGCMGAFPRVIQWDGDGRKDLLVGQADGKLRLFMNVNTDTDPRFDAGQFLQVGATGAKVDINVGYRATPDVVDWDTDGDKDLVVGAYDGRLHLFINQGTDFAPDFVAETFVTHAGGDLVVPSARSSPVVRDLDGDHVLDVLSGNTDGKILYYNGLNFAVATEVQADGVPIDLAGTPRSRPALCHWTSDDALDLLVGAGDGYVRLYQGDSCDLVLDVNPTTVLPNDLITFTTARGKPGDLAGLFVVDVNGGPCFQLLLVGKFAADHQWQFSLATPPGLAGFVPTFRAYAYTPCGFIDDSNDVVVTFQ